MELMQGSQEGARPSSEMQQRREMILTLPATSPPIPGCFLHWQKPNMNHKGQCVGT